MKTLSSSRLSASFAGLAMLAALSLSAVPIQAQTLTLNSGDSLIVSGAGTVGTLGGKPVSNTTSSYYGGANGGPAATTYGTSTFTLANGGTLTSTVQDGYALVLHGSGAIAITGGSISAGRQGTGMFDNGSGPITISGGTFSTGQDGLALYSYNGNSSSIVHPITVTGGTFSAGDNGTAFCNTAGPVNISGGTFSGGARGLYADSGENGAVTVSGGHFSAGPGGNGLYERYSTIDLFSFTDSPFLIDGVAMNNMTLDSSLYISGTHTISATLANGDALNTTFQTSGGKINLNIGTPPAAVPEASTTVSLGLLLILGLGAMTFARWKKATQETTP